MQFVAKPHDKIFKDAITNPKVAKDLLQQHLPKDLKQKINFETLKSCHESYIDEDLALHCVDALFSVKIANYSSYIYILVEHQSKPEKYMAFRMVKYTLKIMEDHIKKKKVIPLVYPMVVYNGTQPYNYPIDIRRLIDAPKKLVKKYLFQQFNLINLNKITDKELRQSLWGGMLQYFLKHAKDRDILLKLQQSFPGLKEILAQDGEHYIISLLKYWLVVSNLQNYEPMAELARDNLSKNMGDEIMTLGERLINRGRKEGLAEGIQVGERKVKKNIIANMLEAGFQLDIISKITGLSKIDIEKLMLEKQHTPQVTIQV